MRWYNVKDDSFPEVKKSKNVLETKKEILLSVESLNFDCTPSKKTKEFRARRLLHLCRVRVFVSRRFVVV